MKENKELPATFLAVVIIVVMLLLFDFLAINNILIPLQALLKPFIVVHGKIVFVKSGYTVLLIFYFALMPRLKMRGTNSERLIFVSISFLLSFFIILSTWLPFLYSVYIFPIILCLHIPFTAFAVSAMRKGFLKDEQFFDGISNEESDFYFKFGTADGELTIHKPQQNIWIDGGPGSGKSDTFIKSIITQSAERGYAGLVYDWEGDPKKHGCPLLSSVAYGAVIEAKKKNPNMKLEWAFINFTDMMRTKRVNVLSEKYLDPNNPGLYIKNIVTTLMKNLEPSWKEKTDFWANNAINYVYSVAYLCYKQRDRGINTLAHVISICLSDSDAVFSWIEKDDEISKNMASMLTAWRLKAQQQTAGAVSSAQLPLSLMNNKYIFWVLSPRENEEFSLDITNKEHPTLLCLGNAPSIKEAVSPAIGSICTVIMSQMNNPGKNKSILCVDEIPTVNLNGIDVFIGTARKHYVSTILALQDFNQMVRDYGEKSAEILKANCGSQFFGMTGNKKTAQDIQELFGEYKKVSESFSEQDSGGGSRSESLQKEKIIMTRDVAGQPTGHFIGKIANGKPPFFSTQFDCYTGPFEKIPPFSAPIFRKELEPTVDNALEKIRLEKGTHEQYASLLIKYGVQESEVKRLRLSQLSGEITKEDVITQIRKISSEIASQNTLHMENLVELNYQRIEKEVQELMNQVIEEKNALMEA